MLTWYEMENENGYIGFDDDCPSYFVRQDEGGWYWEDSWGFGVGGFDTAELAMADAEKDAPAPPYDCEPLNLEEIAEILGDREFERRREERVGW